MSEKVVLTFKVEREGGPVLPEDLDLLGGALMEGLLDQNVEDPSVSITFSSTAVEVEYVRPDR